MDILSAEQRSLTMSRIRSKNTKPELIVRRYLFANGFRYRVNVSTLPGKPDIVLRKYRTAIFIHGCFWHGHDCLKGRSPKTNPRFWENKFNRNKERDVEVREKLKKLGWNTLIVWECQLKPKVREKTLEEICYWLNEAFLSIYKKGTPKTYSMEEITPSIAADSGYEYKEIK